MDERASYRVRYSYVDQFGSDHFASGPHHDTLAHAQLWAQCEFLGVEPDAWWIERIETVEFHTREA